MQDGNTELNLAVVAVPDKCYDFAVFAGRHHIIGQRHVPDGPLKTTVRGCVRWDTIHEGTRGRRHTAVV